MCIHLYVYISMCIDAYAIISEKRVTKDVEMKNYPL